jgi:broad specificity phosphatase PhoE
MDFMHLYVVRHGETWANAEHRYLGSLDPGLTERGKQQAQALEAQLPSHIDAMIVSPRLRAQQTADILNRGRYLQLQTMDCFRERDVGVFEGLTQAEAKDLHPHLWSQNITRQWDIGPTGGESIADVVMRVREGLLGLAETLPSKIVVLVAHGFIAKTIRALAMQDFSDFYDWQLPNGNVLVLDNFEAPSGITYSFKNSLPVL